VSFRDSSGGIVLALVRHFRISLIRRRPDDRHAGYTVSERLRKRVEEIFGWLKTVALFRKTRHRGVLRVGWLFTFATAVYNLVRIRNLLAEQAA
jgi:Transposase DDE domain